MTYRPGNAQRAEKKPPTWASIAAIVQRLYLKQVWTINLIVIRMIFPIGFYAATAPALESSMIRASVMSVEKPIAEKLNKPLLN